MRDPTAARRLAEAVRCKISLAYPRPVASPVQKWRPENATGQLHVPQHGLRGPASGSATTLPSAHQSPLARVPLQTTPVR
jgi:hypothetical protein